MYTCAVVKIWGNAPIRRIGARENRTLAYWGPQSIKTLLTTHQYASWGPLKLFSKSLQQRSYAAAVVDRSHVLNQWFLTGVRPNPQGSVSQPQRFGRGPLKYKHSPRLQSEIGRGPLKCKHSPRLQSEIGRGPLKCKHSPRLQSEIGQPTAKRRTRVESITVICSWRVIVYPVYLYIYSRVVGSVGRRRIEALSCGGSGCGSCGLQASLTACLDDFLTLQKLQGLSVDCFIQEIECEGPRPSCSRDAYMCIAQS